MLQMVGTQSPHFHGQMAAQAAKLVGMHRKRKAHRLGLGEIVQGIIVVESPFFYKNIYSVGQPRRLEVGEGFVEQRIEVGARMAVFGRAHVGGQAGRYQFQGLCFLGAAYYFEHFYFVQVAQAIARFYLAGAYAFVQMSLAACEGFGEQGFGRGLAGFAHAVHDAASGLGNFQIRFSGKPCGIVLGAVACKTEVAVSIHKAGEGYRFTQVDFFYFPALGLCLAGKLLEAVERYDTPLGNQECDIAMNGKGLVGECAFERQPLHRK